MKHFLRRTLIFLFAIWLFLALSPLALQALLSAKDGEAPASSSAPESTDPDGTALTGTFHIYDESQEKVLTVSEEDFLRSALLCEMSADAPEEALKAQAVAIYTVYSRRRLQNTDEDADFACNTAEHRIYTTEEELSAWFGDTWDSVREKIDTICTDVEGQLLTCLLYTSRKPERPTGSQPKESCPEFPEIPKSLRNPQWHASARHTLPGSPLYRYKGQRKRSCRHTAYHTAAHAPCRFHPRRQS